MRNRISDLNNILFEQIERINDDSLTAEEMGQAIDRSMAISKLSETILKNAELAVKATKMKYEYGLEDGQNAGLPEFLGAGK